MAQNTALGIQNVGDVGTSALAMRKAFAGLWGNPGILTGLAVTGTTGLTYNVAAGSAVVARSGEADGYSVAMWDGGATPAVPANDTGKARTDLVVLKADDPSHGDADNRVCLKVLPGGAGTVDGLVIARMSLPAGATSTAGASRTGDLDYATLRNSSGTVLMDAVETGEFKVNHGTSRTICRKSFTVPTDRTATAYITVSVWPQKSSLETAYNWIGSGYVEFLVDDKVADCFRFNAFPFTYQTFAYTDHVPLRAGTHTMALRVWGSDTTPRANMWYGYKAGYYPGQRLLVVDGGAQR